MYTSKKKKTLVWEATAVQIWNAVFYPDVRLKIHIFISKRYQPAPGQVIPLISLFTSAGQARLKRLTTPAVLRKSRSACSRPFELNYWIWHLIKFSKAYCIQKLNVNSFSISNEENRPRNKEITEFKKSQHCWRAQTSVQGCHAWLRSHVYLRIQLREHALLPSCVAPCCECLCCGWVLFGPRSRNRCLDT